MLVQREYRGEGSLSALATDVDKIDLAVGLTSVKQVPSASGIPTKINVASLLVDAVLANLYQQGKDRAPMQTGLASFETLLRNTNGGLVADLSSLGREAVLVERGLTGLLDALLGDPAGAPTTSTARWTLQKGDSALQSTQLTDAKSDVMLGYIGNDSMSAGAGDDVLAGYFGDDTLNGGDGFDMLYGGDGADRLDGGANGDWLRGDLGTDVYAFSGTWGSDTIEDAGGQGVIEVAGLGI